MNICNLDNQKESLVNDVLENAHYELSRTKDPKVRETIRINTLNLLSEIDRSSCDSVKERASTKSTGCKWKIQNLPGVQKIQRKKDTEVSKVDSTPFASKTQASSKMSKKFERIKGDGHCFFRATGHGLIDEYKTNPEYRKILDESLAKFSAGPKAKNEKIVIWIKKIKELLPKGRSSSDELVKALRMLSCAYNRAYEPQRGGKSKSEQQAYFRKMEETSAWGGGETEGDALQETLGIRICESPDQIHQYTDPKAPIREPLIRLNYGRNHYNLGGY